MKYMTIAHMHRFILSLVLGSLLAATATPTLAQTALDDRFKDRPVRNIRIEGLQRVSEQLVLNQVRVSPGDALDLKIVNEDVIRITHLNRFKSVTARIDEQEDGSLILIYVVEEMPLIADIGFSGNKKFSDQELENTVLVRPGDPADTFLISRGIERIKLAYEEKGHFIVDVSTDEKLLEEQGILIFQIREGPVIKIKSIEFEENEAYSDKELQSKIRSKSAFFIFRKGILSRDQINADAARIREWYRSNGYLDAEAAGDIRVAPNYRDANVVFTIKEGERYTVNSIEIRNNELFTQEQILEVMDLKVGDVYSETRSRNSVESIYNLYGKLGYIETRVVKLPLTGGYQEGLNTLFNDENPTVDIIVHVIEGQRYFVGEVDIVGTEVTQTKVVRRQLRGLQPGQPFDRKGMEESEKRLNQYALFSEAKINVLGDVNDQFRDVLVQVREQDTGSITFGAGISSDAGVIGAIDLVQRNFDIADFPESFGEVFTGKAFRGAGQYFHLGISPGDEISRYTITLREPYFLESPYFVEGTAFYSERIFREWDEARFGGGASVGQRFGDVWSASVGVRVEDITISDIELDTPIDVFAVEGSSFLTTVELGIKRDTTDSGIFPTRGSRSQVTLGRAGALGGDYDFWRIEASWMKFWTVDEDFFGRKTVFSLRARAGHIFDGDAPVFERFYAGGARTIRGFDHRTVGPKGLIRGRNNTFLQSNDPVGGQWMFLMGAEYNFPIFEEVLRGVVFTDSGTVTNDIGFENYVVSVGAGVRLVIPFLGQMPIALDFAVPVVKNERDDERIFTFDIAVPFR